MAIQFRNIITETGINTSDNSSVIQIEVQYLWDSAYRLSGTWYGYMYDKDQPSTVTTYAQLSSTSMSGQSWNNDRQWHTLWTETYSTDSSSTIVDNFVTHDVDGTKTIHPRTSIEVFIEGTRTTFNIDSSLALTPISRNSTITYNANGGTGAPPNQTKLYGESITLSTAIPTRNGYSFLGWDNSSSATTVVYHPGDTYSTEANLNLYAVWQISFMNPEITSLSAYRSINGVYDESGENATVNWAYNKAKRYVNGSWVDVTEIPTISLVIGSHTYTPTANDTTYSTTGDLFNLDDEYSVTLSISYLIDGNTYATSRNTFISGGLFTIDVNEDGTAVAFGGTSPVAGVTTTWKGIFLNDVNGNTDLSTALASKGLTGKSVEEIITYILNNI